MSRELTPQIQIQRADTSEAQVTQQLANFAFETSRVLEQKANHRHELAFKNEAAQEINSIYERNQSNPEQLTRELKASRSALAKNAPFHLRQDFGATFDAQAQPYINKATRNHEVALTDQIKGDTLTRLDLAKQSATVYANGLYSGDPVQAADSSKAMQDLLTDSVAAVSATDARGMPVFGASERFRLTKSFIDDVNYASVRSGYDDADDKEAFLESFNSGELQSSIFLDEEGEFVTRPVRDGMDRDTFERVRNYMERDVALLKKQAAAQAQLDAQLQMIQAVRSDEFVFDPTNKNHKAAVDADWSNFLQQTADLDPTTMQNLSVQYVEQVGVLPTQLESNVTAKLQNGTVEQRAEAADFIERVAVSKPSALKQFSESNRVLARQIIDNINAGLPADQAVEFADKNVFKRDTPEYKARVEMFKADRKVFNEGAFTGFFTDDPDEVPAGMVGDYNTLYRAYYMDGGLSSESAHELANEKIKNRWSISRVDGKNRWMKYAPENMYDNGQDPEWMKEQLSADVLATGVVAEDSDKFLDSLILEVAPETTSKPDPSYLIFEQTDDGDIRPLLKPDGQQMTWQPDYMSSPEFNRYLEQHAGDVKQAMISAKRQRVAKEVEQELIEEGAVIPSEVGLGRAF